MTKINKLIINKSFSISNHHTRIAYFLTWITDFDSNTPALMDLFLILVCCTVAMRQLGNSGQAVVSVSIDCSTVSKGGGSFSSCNF